MSTPSNDADLRRQAAETSDDETMSADFEKVNQRLRALSTAWSRSPVAGRLAAYARELSPQSVSLESTVITDDFAEPGAQASQVGTISHGDSSMNAHRSSTTNTTNSKPDVVVRGTNRPAGQKSLRAHLHTSLAVAAAALVVGLLATTFAVFSHRSSPSTGRAAATSTLAPTETPQPPKSWLTLERLTTTTTFANATPAIAPSDPRIVYEVTTSPQLVLRRTADGGVTWQSFPLPVENASRLMQLYVSPLNPNVVVLHTDGWILPPLTCESRGLSWTSGASGKPTLSPLAALSPAAPRSGLAPCSQFLSTDGGRSWTQTSDFFDNAGIVSDGSGSFGIFMVQGQRLYTYDGYNSNCLSQATACPGLLVSLDGGITWKPASVPSTGSFCGIAMAPTSTVMFAITTISCEGQEQIYDDTIWRSDDAGAHWTPVSQHLQFSQLHDLLVVPNRGAEFPTVYLSTSTFTFNTPKNPNTPNPLPTFTTSFQMSQDGGKTWNQVPTSGIPTEWRPDVIAQTSNGSVIALFGPANSGGVDVLYSWQPGGSRWQEVAPTPPLNQSDSTLYYLVTSSQQGGGDTLWAVSVTQASQGGGMVFINTVYSLQL
jgi:hypothetical protein